MLEKHIAEVKLNSLFEGTDFKLASCSSPTNDKIAKECGFTTLSIRVVKVIIPSYCLYFTFDMYISITFLDFFINEAFHLL